MSKIIVIEGADRCGKFTQTHLLQEYITRTGSGAVVVEVPIRSAVTYRIIYWMLQNGLAKKFPKFFQWLQFLNRKIFQVLSLPSLLKTYDYVILDRWSLSTIVYGTAEGIDPKFSQDLADKLISPDYTILLLGKSHMGVAEDVYEADVSLQMKVRNLYMDWAIFNSQNSSIVDCGLSKEEVFQNVIQTLQSSKMIF
jgi:dTMP kinase